MVIGSGREVDIDAWGKSKRQWCTDLPLIPQWPKSVSFSFKLAGILALVQTAGMSALTQVTTQIPRGDSTHYGARERWGRIIDGFQERLLGCQTNLSVKFFTFAKKKQYRGPGKHFITSRLRVELIRDLAANVRPGIIDISTRSLRI